MATADDRTGRITGREFEAAGGTEDWRALYTGACTYFRTGSFATGAQLVGAIAELADAANHHPDVDLRYPGVTVRLFTHDAMGLTQRDVDLARRISDAARELDVVADPGAVQEVQLAVDALVVAHVLPFWRAVLGYRDVGEEDLVDPGARGPAIWFQGMDAPRAQRNRIHVDVAVPSDVAEARVAAAIAAGGTLVSDEHAAFWWTLADAEGNEVDVAVTTGREEAWAVSHPGTSAPAV
jgi:4a-hydroxytetrahydrobiopterin dehydratase